MPATNKEEVFAELVRAYENLWVAIIEMDGVEQRTLAGRESAFHPILKHCIHVNPAIK